jgi:O-antigen ligase
MSGIQRICLYIFFFSMNFEVWDPFHTNGYFSISKLTGIAYFITMIPSIIRFKTDDALKPIMRMILLFFGLLLFMNGIHTNSIGEYFFDFTIFQNIVLFWILINHEQSEPKILEKGMFSFALGSIALALLYYNGIGIEYSAGRVSIFGDNQNIIGLRMCISITILLLTVLKNNLQLKKTRYLLLLPIPIMIGLMVETGSRHAILAFAMVFVAGLVLFKTEKTWWKIVAFLIGIVSVFFIWQFILQNEVLRNRLVQSIYEGNLSNRDAIWLNIIPLIKSHPIFGVGQSGYAEYCQVIYGVYTSPHNVILEVLVFTGITGLIIYFYFLYLIFRRSWLNYKKEDSLLPVLLLMIAFSMIVISHILEVKIGWAIFAYAAGMSILDKNMDKLMDQTDAEASVQETAENSEF